MAHSTDYASRLREWPISTHTRAIAQVLRYFQQDTLATSEQGLKELCLMQYECLGLTPELYDETRKIYLEHKNG